MKTNKHVLKVVESGRNSITHLIQQMDSDLLKLKVQSDAVSDIDIQNEIIRLKDRMNKLETVFNEIFNSLKISLMNYWRQYYKSYT